MRDEKTVIKPEMVIWARRRTGLPLKEFADKLRVPSDTARQWECGEKALTMSQAKRLSSLALIPLGTLFLNAPPHRRINIPDFRSVKNIPVKTYSPELEATVFEMQEKQDWYKSYLTDNGNAELDYVGCINIHSPKSEAVQKIHDILQIHADEMENCRTWEDYFDVIVRRMENAGVTVIRNGVVGNNTHRSLNVEEFRGFVLVDKLAPLIFINGKDSKNAQMFTLIHEFVHILLGESGLIDINLDNASSNKIEKYCNEAAAEFLVPQQDLCRMWECMNTAEKNWDSLFQELAKKFRVSSIVIIIRCKDLGLIPADQANIFLQKEMDKITAMKKQRSSGGNFYATLKYRVGINFAKSIISEVANHNISYQDAFRLLHVKNTDKLIALSQEIGLPIL